MNIWHHAATLCKWFQYVQTQQLSLVLFIMLNVVTDIAFADIRKSPIDEKSYRYFQLDNELKVVVVSDPTADKAAVSLDVAAGSGTDPQQWPGMAHFLEHMLFLGTEKYPESGEYQAFIQQNGGSTNAFTAYDHTNYFYDIDPDFLDASMDRFAQFFISPLFTEQLVERERNAVDSEYYARRTDDFRRTWSARKMAFNAEHPITHFSIGNNQTLADKDEQSVRDALIEFHSNHYSANIMTLAVLGKESVDVLEQRVRALFSDIPNKKIAPFQASVPLYAENSLPKLLEVKTLKQKYSLNLIFSLPEIRSHYATKPLHYLSNLLGHEGRNSLLSELKAKNWVEFLSAGAELNHPEGSSFTISIRATALGFENWENIVASIMTYIRLVEQKGIEQWRFDELADLSELNFDYLQNNEASDYVVFLSSSLQEYPAQELLTASYLLSDYDATLIENFTRQLSPENLLVTLVSSEFDSPTKTNYFNTPYKLSELPESLSQRLQNIEPQLADSMLPEPNPFIPQSTNLKAVTSNSENPIMLVDEENFKFLFKNDLEFNAPRASTYVSIRSAIAGKSARAEVLAQLYTKILREQLNEELYPATLTGLSFEVYSHLRGISIRITGFDDKQEVVLSRILDELFVDLDPAVFAQKKKAMIDKFNNEKYDTPYLKLYDQANDLLVEKSWPNSLLLEQLKTVELTDVEAFQEEFFKTIDVVGLSHGNVDESDAKRLVEVIKARLTDKYQLQTVKQSRVVDLPAGSKTMVSLALEHEDAAVVLFKQGQGKTSADRASMYMLYQLIEAPFFHQLRTTEQLGYIVSASPYVNLNVPYIAMIIESPTTSVAKIIERIDAFITQFELSLSQLSDTEFEAVKKGLIIKIDKKDDTLENRSNRYWAEIDRGNYDFDSRKQLLTAISALSREQIIQDFHKVFVEPGFGEFIAVAPGNLEFGADTGVLKQYQQVLDSVDFKSKANYFD